MSEINKADFTPDKPTFKKLVLMSFQGLTNFPYIEEDFDSLTNYSFLSKIVEYLNEVISNNNEQNDLMTSLYNAYVELQDYVNTYFENLDVQDEINNKLDEMTEDGTLTELIKNYVDPIETEFQNSVNTQLQSFDDRLSSVASGSPAGTYATVQALTSADPDHSKIYVVLADGKWYYYNTTNTSWTAGGVYQSTSVSDTDPIIKSIKQFNTQQGYTFANKRGELNLEPGDIDSSGLNYAGNYYRLRMSDIVLANEDLYLVNNPYIKYYLYTYDDFNYTNGTRVGLVIYPGQTSETYKINAGTYFRLVIAEYVEESLPIITIVENSIIFKNIEIYNQKDLIAKKTLQAFTSYNNNYVNTKITDNDVLLYEKGYVANNGNMYYATVGTSTSHEYTSTYIPFNSTQTLNFSSTITGAETNDYEPWVAYALYDQDFNFISGTRKGTSVYTTSGNDRKQSLSLSNVDSNARYIRFSNRTYDGINISIDISSVLIDNVTSKQEKSFFCESVAHQGYSLTDQYYGNSRLSSYLGAKQYGFTFGECDVRWSSDNVPVCCHDLSFNSNGTTVVISEHTAQELKTYDYFGETIATLEEVIDLCKKLNLGLYIDKIDAMTAEQLTIVCKLVKKYQMLEKVKFLVNSTTKIEYLINNYPNVQIALVVETITSSHINIANAYAGDGRYISIDFDYSSNSVSSILNILDQLNPYVKLECWTIDNNANYIDYLPYVSAITSNKISYDLIYNSLI